MEEVGKVIIVLLTPFIIGLLKRTGISGKPAAWMGFAVCFLVALILTLSNGVPSMDAGDPTAFVTALLGMVAVVYALAQLLYNTLKDSISGLESSSKLEEKRLKRQVMNGIGK